MRLSGEFAPPGDKSISHRVGLLALLAEGQCRVRNFSRGADCASTLAAAAQLGAAVNWAGEDLLLGGAGGALASQAKIDCGNSGTTMRLLMGLVAGQYGSYVLDGDESLRGRPMERVAAPLRLMGAKVACHDRCPPVEITGGGLAGISYDMPVASAQLKSALLLAGMQADGETRLNEPAVSRDHTELMLGAYGAEIGRINGGWRITRSDIRLPANIWVPGDPSSAAFFLCAAAILQGSEVTARQISLNPTRIGFISVLQRMGARMETLQQGDSPEPWGNVKVGYSPGLKACTVEAGEFPLLVDEVPILALTATQAQGTTVFKGVGELRVKESDRLEAIISQLGAMGGDLRADGDDLLVTGPTELKAASPLESFGDHRMAMTLRLAGLLCADQPKINDEECVAISYPQFGEVLLGLLA